MSVKVRALTKEFGHQTAVNQLTFDANPGEILGFLGPNGAGKTTTMKMLCCYTSPTRGTATICDYDINESPLAVRKKIGYLPEHNPLYDDMYVKEYLHFVASIHKLESKSARIAQIIDLTGLGDEQNKIIGTLSKGYRQRVGLAQAIIHDPEVLILDEPTSGLDMNQLIDIRSLIRQLGKEKTVIFSSHIMQEVQALCDRVVIINHGHLVANESIGNLGRRLSGSQLVYVKFDHHNVKLDSLKTIKGLNDVIFDGEHHVFSSDTDVDIRRDIFQHAVGNQLVIIEMRKETANMEDIFRKLTKSEIHD